MSKTAKETNPVATTTIPVQKIKLSQSKGKKVIIYPIPRKTATGIHKFTSPTTGKPLNKTKHGGCTNTIQALYSPEIGGLKNFISYTPWIEGGKQVVDEDGNPLTLQDKEERRWNLPKGYLTNRAWRKGDSTKEEDLTYFQKAKWSFGDTAIVLDLNQFDDLMAYYVALDSKYVANSETEWRNHKWPYATHYIAVENESEQLKYAKRKKITQAFASLHANHMTPSVKRMIATVLGLVRVDADVSDEQVHNLLYEFIQNDNDRNNHINRYSEWVEKTKNAVGLSELEANILLLEAIRYRVLYEKQGAYIWPRSDGQIEIGATKREAIDFITSPKKEGLVEELKKAIKFKKKS